jgi:hypothetical protein
VRGATQPEATMARSKAAYWLVKAAEIWITGMAALILLSYLSILCFDGLWKLWEIANPFNIINDICIFVALSPAYGFIKLAERLDGTRRL